MYYNGKLHVLPNNLPRRTVNKGRIPGCIMQQRCAVTSIRLTEQSVEMCEHANFGICTCRCLPPTSLS